VGVVTVFRLVLNVGGVDGDAACFSSVPRQFGRSLWLRRRTAAKTVIAAVSVVLPWSTWPIVPTLTCGLVRSNLPLPFSTPTEELQNQINR
jgi:hypothetical protein